MDLYEIAKQFLVFGGLGMMVCLMICGYGYWIYQLVAWIRKKVIAHKEKKAAKQLGN